MADLELRDLDGPVAAVLKVRAGQKGMTLEEELRRTLAAAVANHRARFVAQAEALHAAAGGKPRKAQLDSARIIREERDAWG